MQLLRELKHPSLLMRRLFIVLVLYTISRPLFYAFNYWLFPAISIKEAFAIMGIGFFYDISAIVYTNLLFIILHALPFNFRNKKAYQKILFIIFFLFNGFALIMNLSDLETYKYSLHRSGFELVGMQGDITDKAQNYVLQYWYITLIAIAFLYILVKFYPKLSKQDIIEHRHVTQIPLLMLIIGLCVLGARGGFQMRPITPLSASKYVSMENISIATNTPFQIIYSFNKQSLKEKKYFQTNNVETLFKYKQTDPSPDSGIKTNTLPPKNVMVIILESFSSEYIGFFNKNKGYTPFLDSLINQSLIFTNAYSNGKHSNQGIASILASVPSLMDNAFIASQYQPDHFIGLGSILKKHNYATAFFHGGKNGSMNFDIFARGAGYSKYFGKNEFNNPKEDDGEWGIFDEPFFQFTAQKMNTLQQPFGVGIFTLSSHHPYILPPKYINKFPEGTIPMHKMISYVDYSLQKFFDTAKTMPWYNNTLFVFVADHCGPPNGPKGNAKVGMYHIPIIFYTPDGSLKGQKNYVVQQVDILPTIVDYLNLPDTTSGFGKSMLSDTSDRYAVNYVNDVYQIINKEYSLLFDGENAIGLYYYPTDTLLTNNLQGTLPDVENDLLNKLKSLIQTYNHVLLKNKL